MGYGNRTMGEYMTALKTVAAEEPNTELRESGSGLVFKAGVGFGAAYAAIELSIEDVGSARDGMAPRVKCGSLTVSSDPLSALAQMDEARRLILQAQRAVLKLANRGVHLVYFRDCPCDCCSGRGTSGGKTCSHCDGKGVRND